MCIFDFKTICASYQIIDKRRDMLKTLDKNKLKLDVDGKRPKMAFLDNLLTAEVDGKPLTFQEIFEEVSTFMFEVLFAK